MPANSKGFKNLTFGLDLAYMAGIPAVVIILFLASISSYSVEGFQVVPINAVGIYVGLMYVLMFFANFLLFEEIGRNYRRLPLIEDSALATSRQHQIAQINITD